MGHENEKSKLSINILDNLQAMYALWEVVDMDNGEKNVRLAYANNFWLNILGLTPETAYGRLFSDIAPSDGAWIPRLVDVALGKSETIVQEPYSAETNTHFHTQIYAPKHGQVVVLHHFRNQFVKSEAEQMEREQKVSSLFLLMPSAFCIGEVIEDENGEVADIHFDMLNQMFEVMHRFRVNALQGKRLFVEYPDFDAKDEDTGENVFEIIKKTVKKQTKHIFMVRQPHTDNLFEVICYPEGEKRFMCIANDVTERLKNERLLKEANETILSGINYANKIQTNLLPTENTMESLFSDYSVIWKPRDIVGGDIYWVKQFDEGTVLCVCDCTGHGTPGALLTMLVVSDFESSILPDNCRDTANIIWELEQRLTKVFNVRERNDDGLKDGCDIAALFIAKDGSVSVSAAHTDVFVCDGKEVTQHKGQRIFIGEGKIKSKDDIKTIHIPANPDNKFYIASDGLYDQPSPGRKGLFGYKKFNKIILDNHNEKQSVISERVWEAFEAHRGEVTRVDDFQLITFKLK